MKKFLSSIFALAVASSMFAVSAFATDYAEDPDYPEPSAGDGTTAETAADVVSDSIIDTAIQDGAPVYITGDAVVNEAAVAALQNSDTPVTFVAETYSITIDPSKITDTKAISLDLEITSDEETDAIKIVPSAKGDFGMELQITLPAEQFSDIDLESAHLFYVGDDGEIVDMGPVDFDDDGNVVVTISHASYYLVSGEDLASADEASDDISEDEVTEPSGEDDGSTPAATGVVIPAMISIAPLAAVGVFAALSKKKKR